MIGRRTRQEIIANAWPTGQSLVHAGIFMVAAAGLYLAGLHHVAQTVAVLAVATVVNGSISRASKVIAEGIGRLWNFMKRRL